MSAQVNPNKPKQTAKQKKAAEKAAIAEAKKVRRQANVAAKGAAELRSLEEGLKWNDTIIARMFTENPEEAYKLATAEGPDDEEGLAARRKIKANVAAMTTKYIEGREAAEEEQTRNGNAPTSELPTSEMDNLADEKPAVEKTEAQKTLEAAKAVMLGTSSGPAVVYDSSAGTTAGETGAEISERLNADIPEDQIKVDDDLVRESAEQDAKKAETKSERKARIKAEKQAAEIVAAAPDLDEASVVEGILEATKDEPPVEESRDEPVIEPVKAETKTQRKARIKAEKKAAAAAAVVEPVTEVKAEEAQPEPVVEEVPKESPVSDTPAEEAPVETKPEPVVETKPEPVVETKPVVESQRPTLVVSNDIDTTKHTDDYKKQAAKFYGNTFTKERAIYLTEAFRLLSMALKASEKHPGSSMAENTFKRAVDMESRAFPKENSLAMAA